MALDKQINLFRVDTNCFLNAEEEEKHQKFIEEKKPLVEIVEEFIKNNPKTEYKKIEEYKQLSKIKKEYKEWLNAESKQCAEYNNIHPEKIVRKLNDKYLYYTNKEGEIKKNLKNVVSMFDSTLSRSFGIKPNEFTTDIFILEVYYYDIGQDLIVNGFDYKEKHYVYFSSSAGQIRTKKAVFVEEEKYNSCKLKLTCGLTLDDINNKGGMNVNKFLAYLALSNSATDKWEDVFCSEFNIDKTIVVDDFETLVKCKVDNIDYITYEITPDIIKDIPIPHTDGCGMILSSCSKKNFMIRLPFIKGLLGSFDFVKFIIKNNCNPVVKDIWGKEYNIIEDDIQVIFTKSQLKMHAYYESWNDYKDKFKRYGCEAGICNLEEDKIPVARINYQMLQSLYDMTDEEIKGICSYSNKKVSEISSSLGNMIRFFDTRGGEEEDIKRSYFQKAIQIYPEIISDPALKEDLRDLKNALVKKYRGGKLEVIGKFTFVLPDLYAFCEHLFKGEEVPKGLLLNNEVFCKLYKNSDKLDCLRSPSLYIEHAIRRNVCSKKYNNENLSEWFTTDAIYTSTYDLISRILQFDVDGDRLLVLAQKDLIGIAERHMMGVNPLYYEMKKASAKQLNYKEMYEGLKLAFTGGNIGSISNDITKIWSTISTDSDKKEALTAIRWLCMETNFTIDYAKTLFKLKRPESVNNILKKYHRMNVPYFFVYAKDKPEGKVEKSNECVMNKISEEIVSNNIMFNSIKNLKKIDYKMFLDHKNDDYTNEELNKKFLEWNKNYGNNIIIDKEDDSKNNLPTLIKEFFVDMDKIESDRNLQVTSLVNLLYKKQSLRKKKLLWLTYGEILYNNLLSNIGNKKTETEVCMQCGKRVKKGELIRKKCSKCRDIELQEKNTKTIKCIDCGKEFEVNNKDTKSCSCKNCQSKIDKENHQKRQKKYIISKNDGI